MRQACRWKPFRWKTVGRGFSSMSSAIMCSLELSLTILTEAATEDQNYTSAEGNNQNAAGQYVLNTNTEKFHEPACASVEDMEDDNKEVYSGSRDDLINMGYSPCGRCKP